MSVWAITHPDVFTPCTSLEANDPNNMLLPINLWSNINLPEVIT